LITAGAVRICYDARILVEYRQVLLRPTFPFTENQVDSLLDQLQADGDLVTALPLVERLPDPEDEIFLEVALSGNAQYLVTGNLKHYPVQNRQRAQVVSPRAFLDLFRAGGGLRQ
jgi:predicted nucleic acid-binding protein